MINKDRTIDVSAANAARLTEMSLRIRLAGLDMALASGNNGSHLGGSLSCVEIMAVLYGEVLKLDVNDPFNMLMILLIRTETGSFPAKITVSFLIYLLLQKPGS